MSSTTFKVLVADDIPLMRLMLAKYVATAGGAILEPVLGPIELEVLEAANGEEAGELLEQHGDVQLLFLDLMMPVKDGLTLIKELRADSKHDDTKIVVCSAVGDRDVIQRAMSMGAEAYIVKPFTLRTVQDKLTEMYATPHTPA